MLRGKPGFLAGAIGAGAAFAFVVAAGGQTAVFLDGFESGLPCAWSPVAGIPDGTCFAGFRATVLALRDPHVFVNFIFCNDVTDNDLPGFPGSSFNGQLATAIATDGNSDGFLDLSLVFGFRPFAPAGSGTAELVQALCLAPESTTVCHPDPNQTPLATTYTTSASTTCVAPVGGTTSNYSPPVASSGPPCFATAGVDGTLVLNGVSIPLHDIRSGATFIGDPVTGFTNGLLAGFLYQSDADATILPASLPIVGGDPLSVLFPGGSGNCAGHDDRDTFNTIVGWWMYFNYTATPVPYGEP